ncbi:serine/threonine protein kinase [Bradyrhizobium sp. AZCC 1578]|uniref:hypothetical protein n=1 Tax=Bradyrhizobium sp. AZCC 1578 TaxID=3117027 RepID=UPI002FF01B47
MAKKKNEWGGRWKRLDQLTESGQAHIYFVSDKSAVYTDRCILKRVLNSKRDVRFRDEVTAIGTLTHPNIVKLLDHSALDATPGDESKQYLVMPYAKGGDLSDCVQRYRGALDDVLVVAN